MILSKPSRSIADGAGPFRAVSEAIGPGERARRESRGLGKVLPASLQSEVELVRLHGRLLRGHEAGALGEQPAKKKPAS